MSAIFCLGACVACRAQITFNPHRVPSLVINGEREPLCLKCFKRWCELHKQDVPLDPDAYEPESDHA